KISRSNPRHCSKRKSHSENRTTLKRSTYPKCIHILTLTGSCGITEVVLIVGYLGDKIVDYVQSSYDLKVHFVNQAERKGLGHAIYLAKELFHNNEPVLIVLGDTVFEADLKAALTGGYSCIGVKAVDNPQKFGIVELQDGFITRLVEKPSEPPTNLAVVGVYYINESGVLFTALQEIIDHDIRSKGEFQLTDALQLMVERGFRLSVFDIDQWYDCGQPDTLLSTNRCLLGKNGPPPEIPGSILIPPVYIPESAKVSNCIIGPFVSVAEQAEISNSIVKDCIINEGAKVENMLLSNSLIGEHAVVEGNFTQLNIGDSSAIKFTY
ncbi:MAG: sugar phosphate nucleotidyltransferase, partial [Limnochordia bacterium]|nr:sugar phosphate nucleotidyltransferase [Limnochordia bacterium]